MPEDWREQYALRAKLSAYKRRVDKARDVFRQAAAVGPLVVSVSFGKDSVAMADLALETLGAVPFCTMPIVKDPLPGGEHVLEYFRGRTMVHEIVSEPGDVPWCQVGQMEHERSRSQQHGTIDRVKRIPGRTWARANGFRVQCLGLRAEESKGRRANARFHGLVYPVDDGSLYVATPIAWWTAADVWARIAERDLPYHSLYDRETHGQTRETLRNTGWLDTSGAHDGRIAWLRHHYPEQYRMLVAEFPRVAQLA